MGLFYIGKWISFIIVIIQVCYAPVTIRNYASTTVHTRYGILRAVLVEFPHNILKPVEAYFDLEYGALIGKQLRFMPATSPVEKWSGYRSRRYPGYPCPQKYFNKGEMLKKFPNGTAEHLRRVSESIRNTTEDCLTMNIYKPASGAHREWNETTPLPVMVFVHGESYEIGTGNAYDGSVLASYGNVIVVTVNYRLGVLGFLSTGDREASGNYALLDLMAVLQWIRENIAAFGGDTNRVTLFGHGHGAALVNILMLSPMAGDGLLFQRAILQSGSALSSWATSVDPVACTQLLAVRVNCSHYLNNSNALIACLRSKSADELVNNVPMAPKYYSCFAPAPPHDRLFPSSVRDLMTKRTSTFSSANVIFGVTKNEAYSYLKQHEIEHGISEERKYQIIRTYVQNLFRYHKQKIFDILNHEYSEWDQVQDDASRRDNIMKMLSDGQYVAPLMEMAKQHAKMGGDTYLYTFAYSTQSEDFPKWSSGVHGDELPYVFGAPLVDGISPFPDDYTKQEKRLSEAVMRLWTNFAKTGNPNLPVKASTQENDKFADLEWPKFDLGRQQYLQLGKKPTLKHHYRGKELSVWLNLLPKINKPDPAQKGTKPDPVEHLLEQSNNMSTFDDYNRLLTNFHRIFPSPPPIPPMTPPQKDGAAVSTDYINSDSTGVDFPQRSTNRPSAVPPVDVTQEEADKITTAAPPNVAPIQDASIAHSSVPLSIVVAVGCSLLFLNILIFAGVYYQRERIKKLRNENREEEELRNSRKPERDTGDPGGHETSGLMESSQPNQLSPVKIVNTKPDIQNNPIYSAISKPADSCTVSYAYTAVPTSSSSPMHRQRTHHSQCNSTPQTFKPTTFGDISGRPPDRSSPKITDKDRNTYKQDKLNQITSKEHKSSNNAITIV